MRTAAPGRQRGMSLIEALVAMIVMAFGTLAVLGVQATLRSNGDIAKQRAEAVRIAQAALEDWRGFTALDGAAAGVAYYSAIADDTDTFDGTNATYEVARSVVESSDDPRYRSAVVDVTWTDRTGGQQSIRLSSAIAGAVPAFAGTLAIVSENSVVRRPAGRHQTIPPGAVPIEGGRSAFTPPGAAEGVRWVFDNNTGFITQTCLGEACTAFAARLLSGYVRFSTGSNPVSETPDSPRITGVEVRVVQTAPADVAGTVACFEDTSAVGYLTYYCAVPVSTLSRWSGRSELTGLSLATAVSDGTASRYRVCRYTAFRAHKTVPSEMRNDQHPLNYVDVGTSLVNQNFLVIGAGSGATAPYDCPADDTTTPLVDGTTWHHQPAT